MRSVLRAALVAPVLALPPSGTAGVIVTGAPKGRIGGA